MGKGTTKKPLKPNVLSSINSVKVSDMLLNVGVIKQNPWKIIAKDKFIF